MNPVKENKQLHFRVPGKPVPQERPFVTKHGTFDRPKSKKKKLEIAAYARIAIAEQKWELTAHPVWVYFVFRGANPMADIDNLSKMPMDALKNIVWKDDRQVMKLYCRKETPTEGEEPSTQIMIMEE